MGSCAGRLCCSSSMLPFPLKWCPSASGVKCCVGEGNRKEGKEPPRALPLYHRKVSAVEPLPGVSGLTSTLTQATFSWLLYKGGDTEWGECFCKFMVVLRAESNCKCEILLGWEVIDSAQLPVRLEQDFTTYRTPCWWQGLCEDC